MNEEEIIKRLTKPKKYTLIEILRKFKRDGIENYIITKPELVQGLLDLYNKEKERNKDLEQIEKEHKEENGRLRDKVKKIEEYVKQCDWHNNDVYIGEDILELLEENEK